jgi:hypothetical protein
MCNEFEALIVWPMIKLSKIGFFYEHTDQEEFRWELLRALGAQAVVRLSYFFKIKLVIKLPFFLIFFF